MRLVDRQVVKLDNKMLLRAGADHVDLRNNVLPPGVEDAEVFRRGRSGYFVSDDKNPWREVYARQLAASVHPQPSPMRAAE